MRSQAVSFEKSRGIPCLNKKSVLKKLTRSKLDFD